MNGLTRKASLISSLILLFPLMYSTDVSAAGIGQAFGIFSSPGVLFAGQSSYTTITDQSISGTDWSATPVSISTLQGRFIEAGGGKNLPPWYDGTLEPYGSGQGSDGVYHISTDNSSRLLSGGLYRYVAFYNGGSQFRSVWCPGSTCQVMQDVNITGANGLPYVVSGAESSQQSIHWGTVNSKYNVFSVSTDPNTGYYYCYNSMSNTVGATFSGCDSTASFAVTY